MRVAQQVAGGVHVQGGIAGDEGPVAAPKERDVPGRVPRSRDALPIRNAGHAVLLGLVTAGRHRQLVGVHVYRATQLARELEGGTGVIGVDVGEQDGGGTGSPPESDATR
jgi:hypothetical protein